MSGQMDIIRPTVTVTHINLLTQSMLTAPHQHHHMPTAIHSHGCAPGHTAATDRNMLTFSDTATVPLP